MEERDQELRELQYLLEVERARAQHFRDAIIETLKHTAKVCREEWGRERVDVYLREQLATHPPLPDKRILAGSAPPIDWHALADQYARDLRQLPWHTWLWVQPCPGWRARELRRYETWLIRRLRPRLNYTRRRPWWRVW